MLVNVSKAFDRINYGILRQCTAVKQNKNKAVASLAMINKGILQVSTVEPIAFLLYVNDLLSAYEQGMAVFNDDTF